MACAIAWATWLDGPMTNCSKVYLGESPQLIPPAEPMGGVLRTYGVGAQILKDLGVRRMRVLSAPRQLQGISAFDLEIESYVGEDG